MITSWSSLSALENKDKSQTGIPDEEKGTQWGVRHNTEFFS